MSKDSSAPGLYELKNIGVFLEFAYIVHSCFFELLLPVYFSRFCFCQISGITAQKI